MRCVVEGLDVIRGKLTPLVGHCSVTITYSNNNHHSNRTITSTVITATIRDGMKSIDVLPPDILYEVDLGILNRTYSSASVWFFNAVKVFL